ncbi:MAG: hypothetical protein QOI09_2317, partial [Chloroflexota bacterium]|nr:hypothetical protein [Chloroflexota bacterium]
MTEPAFEVIDGGLLTTVQDAGRPAWTHLGVPESGAADPWSLAVANLLVGNETGAAVLEMTVTGPTLVARSAVTIGLAGADLGARIEHGRPLRAGRSHRLAAGDRLTFGSERGVGPANGIRGYLAVANLLVGNESGAAVLEMTVTGPTLVARSAVTIGLAGADLGARIEH